MSVPIVDANQLPLTPPMDLNAASAGSEPISSLPLRLRTDEGVGVYGARRNYEPGLARYHEGVDLLAPEDERVYAAAGGVVVQVAESRSTSGRCSTSGTLVSIHHQPYELGYLTRYQHLKNVQVSRGDVIPSGTYLGDVHKILNNSCQASAMPTHLHFELRQTVDSMLIDEYLIIYQGGSGPYDLSGVSSNIGNSIHSLPIDPTAALYRWEEYLYLNSNTVRSGRVLNKALISRLDHVWRDRLRFVLVRVAGNSNDYFVPALNAQITDYAMIDTLRSAHLAGRKVRIVWRESLFFDQITSKPPTRVIAEARLM